MLPGLPLGDGIAKQRARFGLPNPDDDHDRLVPPDPEVREERSKRRKGSGGGGVRVLPRENGR
jgi:hypothetical protein